MGFNWRFVVGSIACSTVFIICVILFGLSFSKLEANEVAFDYSHNSETVNWDKLYTAGVHVIGVGHEFIKYTRALQEVDLTGGNAFNGRTEDGLSVRVECSFTYRMEVTREKLSSTYMMFKGKHESAYTRIAQEVIRDVLSRFTAFQVFAFRQNITRDVSVELAASLVDYGAILNVFNLKDLLLPAAFQVAIANTQVAEETIIRVNAEIEQATQAVETILIKAREDAKIVGVQANATVQSISLDLAARVAKIINTVDAEVKAYNFINEQLGFTPNQLNSFVWMDTLANSKRSKVLKVSKPPVFNY